MRLADARRSASMMSSSSISESLTVAPCGERHSDWTTNTSAPRTFSRISMRHSSFLNRSTSALPTRVCIRLAISSVRRRFEVPLKSRGGWITGLGSFYYLRTAPERQGEAGLIPARERLLSWLLRRVKEAMRPLR